MASQEQKAAEEAGEQTAHGAGIGGGELLAEDGPDHHQRRREQVARQGRPMQGVGVEVELDVITWFQRRFQSDVGGDVDDLPASSCQFSDAAA